MPLLVGQGRIQTGFLSVKSLEILAVFNTFVNPLFRPYIVFNAFGSENERALGPNRTTSPCFS